MVAASTPVSMSWGATSAAARGAFSWVTISTRASTAQKVPCPAGVGEAELHLRALPPFPRWLEQGSAMYRRSTSQRTCPDCCWRAIHKLFCLHLPHLATSVYPTWDALKSLRTLTSSDSNSLNSVDFKHD
jgi:hypothetical protein